MTSVNVILTLKNGNTSEIINFVFLKVVWKVSQIHYVRFYNFLVLHWTVRETEEN